MSGRTIGGSLSNALVRCIDIGICVWTVVFITSRQARGDLLSPWLLASIIYRGTYIFLSRQGGSFQLSRGRKEDGERVLEA